MCISPGSPTEAVKVGSAYARDRVVAEQQFSEALKGMAEAKDEVRIQREYIRSLQGYCETMARDYRHVEGVARALCDEASRTHGVFA